VRFLTVKDPRVRDAIKHRGESWRLSVVPRDKPGRDKLIAESRVGIRWLPIYYYNRLTGTRWLTCGAFEALGALEDAGLSQLLQEIADHSLGRNRLGRPELDFFAADLRRFGASQFGGVVYERLSGPELRARFEELRAGFRAAVHEAFRKDDFSNKAWCDRMLSTLFLEGNETHAEQALEGLSPEFFLRVEWLAGGRFEEGEFLLDSVFEEAADHQDDTRLQRLCDPRARGIIFNLIRDYGDLVWINVGTIPESLSLDRPQKEGRRGVYLAEFQPRSEPAPLKRFMRLQKWGVWEHLDDGKDLLRAIGESDEYTEYWQDRRLGCRQLGMNLTRRVVMRRLCETYLGTNQAYRGRTIRTTYFEREYLLGMATDKITLEKCSHPAYALRLVQLLGAAAVPSMIVGRSLDHGSRPVFDDGDEVVHEGENGLPVEILVSDHSGAFGEYKLPLENFAAHYARPINLRDHALPNPREMARAYLAAFRERFLHVQGDYRKRRRAFDTLFKHTAYDPNGSFAYRWECILARLARTDVDALVAAIQQHVHVLKSA
jgi:hypothetical protein